MTPEEQRLYDIYAAWSGQLHYYVVKELGRHIDAEYFPDEYLFKVYSGHAQDAMMTDSMSTVPGLRRPAGESWENVHLPRPEDHPTQEDLDNAFRSLCVAAARVLGIDLVARLKKHALPGKRRPKRLK